MVGVEVRSITVAGLLSVVIPIDDIPGRLLLGM